MKKITSCLVLIVCCIYISGCRKSAVKASASFCAASDNEIVSYTRLDPSKTHVVIGLLRVNDITPLLEGFKKQYPGIQPIPVCLQTGNTEYDTPSDWLHHGKLPDIIFNFTVPSDKPETYLEDMSGSPSAGKYYSRILDQIEQNGKIYSLPGPAAVMAIVYNKDLFRKYGWKIPSDFDSFISLCDRIRKDSGGTVEPYNPNGKYPLDFLAGLEGFAYGKVFGGIQNKGWYDDFSAGKTYFKGHMEPFFEMIQRMIDHKLIRSEHFSYSYTLRTKEFMAGRIAMMNIIIDPGFIQNCGFAGFFPFPGMDGGESYAVLRNDYNEVLIKRERTEAETAAVNSFFDYMSTPQAQQDYIGSRCMLSSIKDVRNTMPPAASFLQKTIDNGLYFNRIDFNSSQLPDNLNVPELIWNDISAMAAGTKTAAQVISDCDDTFKHTQISRPEHAAGAELCTVNRTFTTLETSEYIADKFRDATEADIALIPHGSVCCGNINCFFSGKLTRNMLDAIKPRSLANGAKLVKVHMTGRQLQSVLNDPPDYNNGTSNCVYAFSGLKADIAPWNEPGKKYLSVRLADGSAVNSEKMYTVAFWQGMVKETYAEDIVRTYDGTYTDFICNAVKKDGLIQPPHDRRITLIWK